MAMTNMRLPKSKRSVPRAVEEDSSPRYPYGLRISLGKDEIAKLGGVDVFTKGAVNITAYAKVVHISASASTEGSRSSGANVELQITDIDFTSAQPKGRKSGTIRDFKSLVQRLVSGKKGS